MQGWQDHPQFPLDQWEEWLDFDSSINIGMLTGQRSRLVGIDIDDEAGDQYVNELKPAGAWQYTTGKGRRLLFRCDESIKRRRITDELGRSFEVLGDATNNVLPPSEHASGATYAWTPGLTPKEVGEPAELPEWALVAPAGPEGDAIDSDEIDWVPIIMNRITSGQRNEVMTQVAGRFLGPAPLTGKEVYLLCLMINQRYGKPPLQDCEIKAIVKSIGRAELRSKKTEYQEVQDLMNNTGMNYKAALAVVRGQG